MQGKDLAGMQRKFPEGKNLPEWDLSTMRNSQKNKKAEEGHSGRNGELKNLIIQIWNDRKKKNGYDEFI